MTEDLIVIAAHNDKNMLATLLDSLEGIEQDILVVDTHSDNQEFLDYLDTIRYWVERTSSANYDTGAYVHAYYKFGHCYKNFLFLQDSLVVKDKDLFNKFKQKLYEFPNVGCVAWSELGWGGEAQQDPSWSSWLDQVYGTHVFSKGIFGPIFMSNRESLMKLEKNNLFKLPQNKDQQEAMERGWAIAFEKVELINNPLHTAEEINSKLIDLANNTFPEMNKSFPRRS